jgi:DNA-binding NarL/FixJ family response regulator
MTASSNMDDLARLIGVSGLKTLADVRGGTRLYVPTRIDGARHLVQWLGTEATQRLVDAWGGACIDVPNFRLTPSVEGRVLSLATTGLTHAQIALAVGCTERTVRKHLASNRNPSGFTQGKS